eukprot:3206022-Prymnesium_polylepis.2
MAGVTQRAAVARPHSARRSQNNRSPTRTRHTPNRLRHRRSLRRESSRNCPSTRPSTPAARS